MHQDLSLDDFFTGLLAALCDEGVGALTVRGDDFYQAVEKTYKTLENLASDYDVDPRFAIFLDPVYGDSASIREAISGAVLRDVATLDNADYRDLRINLDPDQAEGLLNGLPGAADLYGRLAKAFLGSYRFATA